MCLYNYSYYLFIRTSKFNKYLITTFSNCDEVNLPQSRKYKIYKISNCLISPIQLLDIINVYYWRRKLCLLFQKKCLIQFCLVP